jgi:hypothetical protein
MKGIFAENDDLLFAWRKFMLQCPLTKEEEKMLEPLRDGALHELVKKALLPQIDGDAPFFQMMDLANGLNVELKTKSVDEMLPIMEARAIEIDYLEQRFDELKTKKPAKKAISLAELGEIRGTKTLHDKYVNLVARNHLLSHVDSFINDIRNLAGLKKDSVEETIKKLRSNSAK